MAKKKQIHTDPIDGAVSAESTETAGATPAKKRSILRSLGRFFLYISLISVVVVGIVQVPIVRTAILNRVLTAINPFETASIQYEQSDGSLFSDILLLGVSVTDSTSTPLQVDSVRVQIDILDILLDRRLEGIYIAGAHVDLRESDSGAWSVPALKQADDTTPPDASATPFVVNEIDINSLSASVAYWNPVKDSVWVVESLNTHITDLSVGESFSALIDTVRIAFLPAMSPDLVLMNGRARMTDNRLEDLSLALESPSSSVSIVGTAPFDTQAAPVQLSVRAEPLMLRDISPFVSGLNPATAINMTTSVEGEWADLNLQLEAEINGRDVLSGTGSVSLQNDRTLVSADVLLDRLLVADLILDAGPVENLSGRATVNLDGPTLDAVSGSLTFDLQHDAGGPISDSLLFRTVHLRKDFVDGRGDFGLSVGAAMGNITMSGWSRPFDAEITWEASGDFHLTYDAVPLMDLTGALTTRRTLQPSTPNNQPAISALIELSEGMIGACHVSEGIVSADFALGLLSGKGQFDMCSDQTAILALQSPSDGPWTLSANVTNLDILALVSDSTGAPPEQSAFTGSVLVTGPLGSETGISGGAHIVDSRFNVLTIDSSRVQFTYDNDTITASTVTYDESAIISADAVIDMGQPGVHIGIQNLAFESINIAEILNESETESHAVTDLNGAGSLDLHIDPSNNITSSGFAKLSPSSVNNVASEQLEIKWESIPGSIVFDAIAAFEPDAELHLTGNLSRDLDLLVVEDLEGSFDNLNVAQLAAIDDISTRLTGSINLAGGGSSGHLRMDLDPGSLINDLELTEFDLDTSWNENTIESNSRIASNTGHIHAEGTLARNEASDAAIAIEAQTFDLAALLGPLTGIPDSLRSRSGNPSSVTLSGAVSSLDDGWTVSIDSVRASLLGLRVDKAVIQGHVNKESFMLDSLYVDGGFGTLIASGAVNLTDSVKTSTSLRASADLTAADEFGLFESFIPVTWSNLNLTLDMTGTPTTRRFEGALESGNVQYDGARIAYMQTEFRGELGEGIELEAAELEGDIEVVTFGGIITESVDLDAEYVDGVVVANTLIQIDRRRKLQAEIELDPSAEPITVTVNSFIAELDEEAWQLTAPSEIVLGDLPFTPGLVIESPEGRLALASIRSRRSETLLLDLDNFNLETVSDVLGFEGLGGVIDGQMSVIRPDSALVLAGAFSGLIESYQIAAGSLDVQLALEDEILRINADMFHETGKEIAIEGSFDLRDEMLASEDSTAGAVDLSIETELLPINWIRPFLDSSMIDALSGTVTTDISVHGTFERPFVSGRFQVEDGVVGLTEFGKRGRGLTYSDINADLILNADSIRVNNVSAKSGSGTIAASGTLALSDLSLGEFALSIHADKFLAIDNMTYQAVVDGDLSVSGTTAAPILSGNLNLPTATYYLTNESTAGTFAPVALTHQDLLDVERSFGIVISESDTSTFDLYNALTIDNLSIRLARDSWLRSKITPKMDIQFVGDLDITKQPREDPVVFGTIEVLPDRSQVVQFGRKFRLTRGTVSLNGSIHNPVVDIEATYEVPSRSSSDNEVVIRLIAQGEAQSLNLTFESDPHMELSDVISYIVTGRPAGESLQLSSEGGQHGGTATALALGPMNAMAESIAGDGLGLDVVEISFDAELGLKFTGGKYLNPQLYVSVSQPLSSTSNTDNLSSGQEYFTAVTIEYEVLQDVLASLLARGSVLTYGVRWRYDF